MYVLVGHLPIQSTDFHVKFDLEVLRFLQLCYLKSQSVGDLSVMSYSEANDCHEN